MRQCNVGAIMDDKKKWGIANNKWEALCNSRQVDMGALPSPSVKSELINKHKSIKGINVAGLVVQKLRFEHLCGCDTVLWTWHRNGLTTILKVAPGAAWGGGGGGVADKKQVCRYFR